MRISKLNISENLIDYYRKSLGLQIRYFRHQKCLSLLELSHRTGLAPNTLRRIEQGKFTCPLVALFQISLSLDSKIEIGLLHHEIY